MSVTINPDNSRSAEPASVSGFVPSQLNLVLYKIACLEFSAVLTAAAVSIALYYQFVLSAQAPISLYFPGAVLLSLLVILISVGFHHYGNIQTHRKRWYVTVGLGAVGLAFSVFLSMLFLLKQADEYSRGAFIVQFLVVSLVVVGVRALTHNRLHASIARNEIEARRVVLIGRESHCRGVVDRLFKSGLRIQAMIPLPEVECGAHQGPQGCPNEAYRKIIRQCRPLRPDDILVLAADKDLASIEALTSALSELPASLHMMPIGLEHILATSKFAELGLLPTIQLLQQPLSLFDRFIKRSFDLIAASVGLVVLSPLLLVVAFVIKLESKGPAIFRQARHGFNNETIRVFKFRTMRTVEDGEQKFTQAVKNDPRITKFGSILRSTNIDELPQLVNVLLGEMSLVGPRPHPIALNLKFEDKLAPLFRRHNVKPGMTGWAQVNGCRGETDTIEKMRERLRYDLYYIDHWSFLLDLQIIMMTLVSKKAYANAY